MSQSTVKEQIENKYGKDSIKEVLSVTKEKYVAQVWVIHNNGWQLFHQIEGKTKDVTYSNLHFIAFVNLYNSYELWAVKDLLKSMDNYIVGNNPEEEEALLEMELARSKAIIDEINTSFAETKKSLRVQLACLSFVVMIVFCIAALAYARII